MFDMFLRFGMLTLETKNPLFDKLSIKVLVYIPYPVLDSKKDVTQINLSYCLQLEPKIK
jgi:hypothetical protein